MNRSTIIPLIAALVSVQSLPALAAQPNRRIASHGMDVSCRIKGQTNPLEFVTSNVLGELPLIEFLYPMRTTEFSLRNGNLLLITVDQEDPSRVRAFVSAQLDAKSGKYQGQMMIDAGGSEVQLENGKADCRVTSSGLR